MSVQHWKFQRISAIALIPIVLFSLYYIVSLGTVSYDHLINDLGSLNGPSTIKLAKALELLGV